MTSRLTDFEPLLPAEKVVLAELQSGEFDRLGDGSLPVADDPDRIVRAGFLRFLLIGGEEGCRPHEKGVRVGGAWITGVLDLEGCRIPRDIGLNDCHFEAAPVLRSAIIDRLFLDGSTLPGLDAERLEARGGLYLRAAVLKGEFSLVSAGLGGNLECDGIRIERPGAMALNGRGLEARSVLLRGAEIRGGLSFAGAEIAGAFDGSGMVVEREQGVALNAEAIELRGSMSLRKAGLRGETRLQGARIAGDLDCSGARLDHPQGDALQISRATIAGGFFLRGGAAVDGVLDLSGASFSTLHDDEQGWPKPGYLLLNRCLYQGIIEGPVNAGSRLDWLARQTPERWGEDFWPQPYEQLAQVFYGMGHDEDARAVLIHKERLQRRARRGRESNQVWRAALAVKDWMLRWTVAYGRQPLLAFIWLGLFWLVGVGVFALAERTGALKPNSPVVLRSTEWTLCGIGTQERRFLGATQQWAQGRAEPGQTQLDCFRSQWDSSGYPVFNPWMFSLDTLFPVMNLGQREYWRPDPSKPWGMLVTRYFYFESIVGWALSLLAVAGFSGLVKSR